MAAAVIEEYPFIFMNTPSSLQLRASSEVALMLWRYAYSDSTDISLTCFLDKKFRCEEVLDDAPIPSHIRAQIDEKIVTIRDEVKKWIDFVWGFDYTDDDCQEEFSKCFKHVVVDARGAVNFKATAVNMLNAGELSDVINYQIACKFCLEDEIARIWPLIAEDVRIGDIAHLDDVYDLVIYWTSRLNADAGLIDDGDFNLSVECRLRDSFDEGNWPAFEFFWNMLSDEERACRVISFLRVRVRHDSKKLRAEIAIRFALPTLTRIGAERVFQAESGEMIEFLVWSNDDYLQHLCQLWSVMENTFSKKKSSFFGVLRELWSKAFVPDAGRTMNFTRCDQINQVLLEIWSRADDELKDYVSNTHVKYFFDRLSTCWDSFFCYYGHDTVFITDLVRRSTSLNKVQFWRDNWRTLSVLVTPSCLEDLMSTCLPNDDIEIKSWMVNFKDICIFRSWIGRGFYSELKDYLMFCSNKDEKPFQQLGKKALESNLDVILLHDDVKFAQFEWFVGEVFSNVQKDVDEFKVQIISSDESLNYLLEQHNAAAEISSDYFGGIIDRFITNEAELKLVKILLLKHCHNYLPYRKCETGTFNAWRWQMFLEWCINDVEELSAFKRSLNIGMIFVARLSQYLDREGIEVLRFLDTFLEWYFNYSKEDEKEFILYQLKNYKRINNFYGKLKTNHHCDRDLMYKLLRWFLR